ncbi:TraB/GumN family protein [Flavobacterium sp.]|uniref:TraB/GumN family protein n=1 Tax=Flavobacterium sp. TaxID=239 RepID=UPI002FD9BD22
MIRLLFWVVLCCFSFVQGQTLEKTLLWKISGNGIENPSYLYGTIHITCDNQLPTKVVKALNETQQLYLELDLDSPTLQQEMMMGMTMRNGITMSSLSSEEDFKIVDAFLKKNIGFSATMLNAIKPFMVSAMLYPKMIDCQVKSIENALMEISKNKNQSVFGLETVKEQMEVFETIAYDIQMEELIKTAKSELVNDRKEMQQVMAIYASEDVDKMVEFSKKSDNKISSQFDSVLLENRNVNWIPKIIEIAQQKSTFFGVGAAHLGGEMGVIRLLRKSGFTVEPVF